jgi:MarR family transcriptional regulator for hemolysin
MNGMLGDVPDRPPLVPPIGLRLSRTAHVLSAAFDRAMAEAMGIRAATLTHHLNALERQGFVRRWRDDANRRVQQTELTPEGLELFDRLRSVAMAHDQRLRGLLEDDEVTLLAGLLDKLKAGFAQDAQLAPAARVTADEPPR